MAQRRPEVAHVRIEWPTRDRTRRADVYAQLHDGSELAFELQYRPLSDPDFTARCGDYARNGITSVWLWRPGLARPGIMLQQHQPIWWLDVESRQITGLFGQPHPRPADWHTHEDLTMYALHWPPCPGDGLAQYTWPVADIALNASGLTLPPSTAGLIHGQQRRLHDQAAALLATTTPPAVPQPASRTYRGQPPQLDPSAGPYVPPPADMERLLHQHLAQRHPDARTITIGLPDARWANGQPVYADGNLVGVACPHPSHPQQWRDLYGHRVYVPYNQTYWFARTAPLGTRLEIIRDTQEAVDGS